MRNSQRPGRKTELSNSVVVLKEALAESCAHKSVRCLCLFVKAVDSAIQHGESCMSGDKRHRAGRYEGLCSYLALFAPVVVVVLVVCIDGKTEKRDSADEVYALFDLRRCDSRDVIVLDIQHLLHGFVSDERLNP